MTKKAQQKQKALRKEKRKHEKAKKSKKQIIILVAAIAVFIIAAVVILSLNSSSAPDTEVYSDGHQTVTLLPDGTFTAELVHDERESGTYDKTDQGGLMIVSFTVDDETVYGLITDDTLYLPEEWQDDHGHNSALPKQ